MPISSETLDDIRQIPGPGIFVRGLSKCYASGRPGLRFSTFRESFGRWARGGAPAAEVAPESAPLWALRDIHLRVLSGEVVAVVGPNGAGKSTLLRILSRITEPSEGTAVIKGRVASVLGVGAGFHPELTGLENLYLNGAMLGMRRDEIRARESAIVDFAEVARFRDTPIKHYSSGMCARLAFAVAAHLEADILLVDETLAVGDEAFQRRSLEKMVQIGRRGGIVVMVTHELDLVRALCSSAYLLREGRLVSSGPAERVLEAYGEQAGSVQA